MRRHAPLLLAVAIALLLPGCRMVRLQLGLGVTITTPDPGTPERLVQDVLRAALNADEDSGWEAFEALLHSEEAGSPRAHAEWRQTKFEAIRRKAAALVEDPGTFAYRMMDYREDGDTVQIFVRNRTSDLPTPCRVKPDPAVRGAYRVFNACF